MTACSRPPNSSAQEPRVAPQDRSESVQTALLSSGEYPAANGTGLYVYTDRPTTQVGLCDHDWRVAIDDLDVGLLSSGATNVKCALSGHHVSPGHHIIEASCRDGEIYASTGIDLDNGDCAFVALDHKAGRTLTEIKRE